MIMAVTYKDIIRKLRSHGETDVEVAKNLGLNTNEYRILISSLMKLKRESQIENAKILFERGLSKDEIAVQMNEPVSTITSWIGIENKKEDE